MNDMSVALPVIGDLGRRDATSSLDSDQRSYWGRFRPDEHPISHLRQELQLKLHEFVDEVGEIVDKAQKRKKSRRTL